MVEAELGVAIVPERLAVRYAAGGSVVAIRLTEDGRESHWKTARAPSIPAPPPPQPPPQVKLW